MSLCRHWEAEWHQANQGTTGKGGHERSWLDQDPGKSFVNDGRLFLCFEGEECH